MCIHPRQVALAHQVFTPTEAELAHARAVVRGRRGGRRRGRRPDGRRRARADGPRHPGPRAQPRHRPARRSRIRREHGLQAGSDRQPRRDRAAHRARLPRRLPDQHRGLRRARRGCARSPGWPTRRCHCAERPRRSTYLDIATLLAAAGAGRRRSRPPGLRLPGRERRLRPGGPRRRPGLDRAAARGHPRARRQGGGRAIAARAGAPLLPGTTTRGRPGRGGAVRRGARAADRDQGRARRRRPRPAGRARGRRGGRRCSTRRCARPAPRSAAASASSRPTSTGHGTSRRRSWRTCTATSWSRGPATAPCSGATRNSSRRRPRRSSPAPSGPTLERSAEAICREAGYVSAGTVEFLLSPRRRAVLPRGQHPPAGRAHGDRGERPISTWSAAQLLIAAGYPLAVAAGPRRPAAARHRVPDQRRGPRAGLRSLDRPDHQRSGRRPGPGYASTPASRPAAWSAGSSTRCWPSWSSPAGTGRRPSSGHAARSPSSTSPGCSTTLPFLRAVLAEPAFTAEGPGGFAVHTRWIEQDYLPARPPADRR